MRKAREVPYNAAPQVESRFWQSAPDDSNTNPPSHQHNQFPFPLTMSASIELSGGSYTPPFEQPPRTFNGVLCPRGKGGLSPNAKPVRRPSCHLCLETLWCWCPIKGVTWLHSASAQGSWHTITKQTVCARTRSMPPPPPTQPPPKFVEWEKIQFAKGHISRGHFWCTNFWIPYRHPPTKTTHTKRTDTNKEPP